MSQQPKGTAWPKTIDVINSMILAMTAPIGLEKFKG